MSITNHRDIKKIKSLPQGISSTMLKLIAIITMLIDHFGLVIYTASPSYTKELYDIFRLIGRVSFPIFCFLLVEGFRHTKNEWHYAGRLLLFALISEIPFDFALHQTVFYPDRQNVFFTLFLALMGLIAIRHWSAPTLGNNCKKVIAVTAVCAMGYVFKVDYKGYAVFYMILLYLFGNYGKIWMECIGVMGYAHEITAPLAFIPIHFYNGKRGMKLKYVFYIIYPGHLLLFGWIRWYLLNHG